VAQRHGQSVGLPQIVGTPEQIADQLEDCFVRVGGDGFMLSPIYSPGAIEEFVDLVVPVLQRRGLFRREYRGTRQRDHLRPDD
jgi:long-chain alkane monooxygenase